MMMKRGTSMVAISRFGLRWTTLNILKKKGINLGLGNNATPIWIPIRYEYLGSNRSCSEEGLSPQVKAY